MKKLQTLFSVLVLGLLLAATLTYAAGGTYDAGIYNFPSILNIGTTTSWTANANVVHIVVKEPLGNGTNATTTMMLGDAATTTSRSSIQMNNTVGAAECLDVVGTVVTVAAGKCN
jgi:hypothetical protein